MKKKRKKKKRKKRKKKNNNNTTNKNNYMRLQLRQNCYLSWFAISRGYTNVLHVSHSHTGLLPHKRAY